MDRAGLGRKAERIDRGEQLPASGVLLPQLLVLLPQLLGFFLDLLGIFLDPLAVVPDLQDFALDLLDSLFAPLDRDPIFVHPLLVTGIPTPIQHRQKQSPPRQR
jgi:hypothetical protein